ncbi:MAG: hypothetical protein U1E19_12800 [Rhodoblastus sp.]
MPHRIRYQRLRSARRNIAERCLEVASIYTPRDVQVSFRKGLTGCAWARSRRISAPRPLTRRALHVYLHEIAHVVLEHFHDRPVHEQEFEAEEWALGVMQREGIGVPRASLQRAQAYVAQTILGDSQATAISLRAAAFARAYL